MNTRRMFYSRAYLYLSLGLVTILAGFLPSYFSKLAQTDLAHHFHGITATAWMLILIVQPLLYRLGKLKSHRALGWIAVGIAGFVILGGLKMMQIMILKKDQFGPGDIAYQLAFIDLFTILAFSLYIALAVLHRKNTQLHARYMVSTIFGPLVPAIFRIFFLHGITESFQTALTLAHLVPEFVLLLLIFDDKRSGRIRTPYVLALSLLCLQHLLMYSAGHWGWWQTFMEAYASLF